MSSPTTATAEAEDASTRIRSNYAPIDFRALGLEWKHEENESRDPRAIEMARECRTRLIRATRNVIDAIQTRKEQGQGVGKLGLILSGGVDTCAILEAATSLGIVFDICITVVIGGTSPDELYSKYAAWQHNLASKHRVVKLTATDLIDKYLPRTIKTCEVWDGMTIRNSLVIAAAFEEARSHGVTDVLVGDGADELFGGYAFAWGEAGDPAGWKAKRDAMCRNWTFATDALAASYGLAAHAPFEDRGCMVDWALSETQRGDCVADDRCWIQLLLGQPYQIHTTGKVVLREAFRTGSSWRRKDPIEKGSGATVIGHDDYWTTHGLSDEEYEAEKERLQREERVTIRTKENLVNLRIYKQIFGGLVHPKLARVSADKSCLGCPFELERPDAMFCHLCGAWPARKREPEEINDTS